MQDLPQAALEYQCYSKELNPIYSNILFLYPLKRQETIGFSDVFRGYRNGTLC